MQYVTAIGNRGQVEWPIRVRDGIQWRRQRDYNCAHFRMNIAEDVADSGTIEAHHFGGSRFIQAEIKTLAFEQRKNVVKKGIAILELDERSGGNHEHVLRTRVVFLV